MKTQWCEVEVLKNGRMDWPFINAVVSGVVSGGHTEDFRTDDRGIARIMWYSDGDLKKIYVSGHTFEGPFENGRKYTLSYWV